MKSDRLIQEVLEAGLLDAVAFWVIVISQDYYWAIWDCVINGVFISFMI